MMVLLLQVTVNIREAAILLCSFSYVSNSHTGSKLVKPMWAARVWWPLRSRWWVASVELPANAGNACEAAAALSGLLSVRKAQAHCLYWQMLSGDREEGNVSKS